VRNRSECCGRSRIDKTCPTDRAFGFVMPFALAMRGNSDPSPYQCCAILNKVSPATTVYFRAIVLTSHVAEELEITVQSAPRRFVGGSHERCWVATDLPA